MPAPDPSSPSIPWSDLARRALDEDGAFDDVTTRLLGAGADVPASGRIIAEGSFVAAGYPFVEAVFRTLDPDAAIRIHHADGEWVAAGDTLVEVRAPARVLLAGERVALNGFSRLSGIATITRRVVEAVEGTGAVVTDTRKTTPGLRSIEKYAVRVGGGVNHRLSLSDAVLWKDNHWVVLGDPSRLHAALASVPAGLDVCVEVETEEQLRQSLAAGAKWILVDNQTPETVAAWVRCAGPEVVIEASGRITAANARAYAEAGARRLSVGALTYAPDPVSIRFDMDAPAD